MQYTLDLSLISNWIGLILGFIALGGWVIKPLKAMSVKLNNIEDNMKEIRVLREDIDQIKKINAQQSRIQEAHGNAVCDILRQMIIDKTELIIARGKISTEEIYVLRKLNNSYKALGGNSTVGARVKKAVELEHYSGEFEPDLMKV